MAIENTIKEEIIIDLYNGTRNGVTQTVSISLNNLSINSFDADKVLNIVDYLEPCLTKEIVKVRHRRESNLSYS